MALASGDFKAIADSFMTDDFAAFAKTLVMRTADAVTYGSAQTYTSEAGTGIDLQLNYSAYSNPLIQSGDFVIFTNASQWTTNPRSDNIDIVFDGQTCTIIDVEKDADNAAYFLTVRLK